MKAVLQYDVDYRHFRNKLLYIFHILLKLMLRYSKYKCTAVKLTAL